MLRPDSAGLYSAAGDCYIDPIKPVPRALITHAHADHARAGHGEVYATRRTLDIMAIRYGENFCGQQHCVTFDSAFCVNGVNVSFHPAGHILGSAQIRLELDGLSVLFSGDYKRGYDPTAEPFCCVSADVFITEATFGLPVFKHPAPAVEIERLLNSLRSNPTRTHLLGTYALGKTQRIIRLLRDNGYEDTVYLHGAMIRLCEYYESEGIELGLTAQATVANSKKSTFSGGLVLAPPSALNSTWVRRFEDPLIASASGWMQVRQRAKQRGVELPLIISDHCDWSELTQTITEIAPREVLSTLNPCNARNESIA